VLPSQLTQAEQQFSTAPTANSRSGAANQPQLSTRATNNPSKNASPNLNRMTSNVKSVLALIKLYCEL